MGHQRFDKCLMGALHGQTIRAAGRVMGACAKTLSGFAGLAGVVTELFELAAGSGDRRLQAAGIALNADADGVYSHGHALPGQSLTLRSMIGAIFKTGIKTFFLALWALIVLVVLLKMFGGWGLLIAFIGVIALLVGIGRKVHRDAVTAIKG